MNEGLRIVRLTVPSSHAGGITNCTRSPLGSTADSIGVVTAMLLLVKAATEVAIDIKRS